MEKDSENLRLLVSLWDDGGGNPFIGEPRVAGWPRQVAKWPTHVAKAPPLFPKVVVVEVKERVVEEKREQEEGDGRPATHFCRPAKLWTQFYSTFHHPPHLDPLMFKPLTKSIKSNKFLSSFSKVLFFFLKILDFITCNDEINKHDVEKE
jgi:hypothetical protein